MAKRIWTVIVEGQQHTVEWNQSLLTDAVEILVDGKVVKVFSSFSPTLGKGQAGTRQRMAERSERRVVEFEVAGKPAILRQKLFGYELFVDGQKVKQVK
jgi:hypothetical protein